MISGKKADNSVLLQVRKWRQCSHFSWHKPNALFLDIVNMAMNFVPQKKARHHYTIDGTLCRFQIWTEVFCFQCNQLDLSQRLVDSGEKNFMQNVRKELKKLRSTQKEKSPCWVAGIKSCPASWGWLHGGFRCFLVTVYWQLNAEAALSLDQNTLPFLS